jgi:branched-chain amino acid transport system permease protein
MLRDLIEVLISGITNGSVYAIMAAGMTLVYGVTRVFNFAYGSFFTLGGYFAWLFFGLKFSYLLVFVSIIPAMFLMGLSTEKFVIRPLRARKDWGILSVMVTLGLALFLDNLYLVIFGPFVKSIPSLFEGYVKIQGLVISINDITIVTIAISIMVILMLFLSRSRQGLAMRAVAQDMTGAEIVGIPKDRVFAYTFAVSAVLVGAGSMLLAPKYFVSPAGGFDILVKSWVITVFGGVGSVRGSLFAAFILGIIEAVVGWQFGFTWTLIAWFVVLLFTLIVRPQGLFGAEA